MTLLAPFDRSLALRLGPVPRRGASRPPCVPPPVPSAEPSPVRVGPGRTQREVARFLVYALLADVRAIRGVVSELEASVDERVVVWSPCLYTTSRTELVAALLDSDDAVSDIDVSIVGEASARSTVHVEWRIVGRFDHVGLLNDDVLVEPSGARVECGGVLVMDFDDRRATRIRCFHDELGLLEQVLSPPAGARPGAPSCDEGLAGRTP